VFPLSNWTELDIWQYIHLENIPIVPLYFAAERPVVERDGTLIMVDDDRMPLRRASADDEAGALPHPGLLPADRRGRVRPPTRCPKIIQEMLLTTTSERQGRGDRPRPAGLDGEEEAGGLFLMAPTRLQTTDLIATDIASTPTSSSTSTRACCASSPAAASTTARAR
jgi:sulfate adenylyltransferase subunit 2